MTKLFKIHTVPWVDNLKYGPPDDDDEGMYLCAFSDGTIETLSYSPGDYRYWKEPTHGVQVTHWAELPEHPGRSSCQ